MHLQMTCVSARIVSSGTSKSEKVWYKVPTRAGEGSCFVRVRWRTADGAMTQLSVNDVSRRCPLEVTMATGVMECVGAWLMEL